MTKTEQSSTSKEIPKHRNALIEKYEKQPEKTVTTEATKLPKPTGWRMLILPYRGKGKTQGGVFLPDSVVDDGQITTVVGYVMKQGELCYKDQEKFPNGAWCKQGDWVIFARYSGSRFKIEGGEVRILNDDEILAVINDPDDILSL